VPYIAGLLTSIDYHRQSERKYGALRWAPLHQAAFNDNMELVQFLLHAGADPAAKTPNGKKPHELTSSSDIRKLLQRQDATAEGLLQPSPKPNLTADSLLHSSARTGTVTEAPFPAIPVLPVAAKGLDIPSYPSVASCSQGVAYPPTETASTASGTNVKSYSDSSLGAKTMPGAVELPHATSGLSGQIDIPTWCAQHDLPQELADRFHEELLETVDDIYELTRSDIDKICVGFKLGVKSRLKLTIKRTKV